MATRRSKNLTVRWRVGEVDNLAVVARMAATTPEERLRWLLRFVNEDLNALAPEARAQRGVELTSLRPMGDGVESWVVDTAPDFSLDDTTLRQLQTSIRRGLDALLTEQPWPLPVPRGAAVRRSPVARDGIQGRELAWTADARAAILHGVARLIQRHGEPLRSCARCGRAFFKKKRQTFCAPACAQAVRDTKKAALRKSSKKAGR